MSTARWASPAWTSRPGELLLHPFALTALGALLLNDHVLKAQWPGLVTGKLSDFAGLLILPLFLHAIWIGAVRITGRVPDDHGARVALFASCLVSGLAFAAIKLSVVGNAAYSMAFGVLQWPLHAAVSTLTGSGLPPVRPVVLVMDPWDLLALAMLAVPLLLLPGERLGGLGPMIPRQLIPQAIRSRA